MHYVDGFVLAVPTKNKEAYIKHAREAGKIFKQHGALSLVECWGDDVPEGETTSFLKAVKCQADETVCFSWLTWPSKKARDEGMQKAMQDELFKSTDFVMPFDGKRMIFGGFEMIVND